ncbi:MAG: hypothetical protein E7378_00870 [Clostridiales bacterium]|nr:hypothetical protein [Clostridiales bacterium]
MKIKDLKGWIKSVQKKRDVRHALEFLLREFISPYGSDTLPEDEHYERDQQYVKILYDALVYYKDKESAIADAIVDFVYTYGIFYARTVDLPISDLPYNTDVFWVVKETDTTTTIMGWRFDFTPSMKKDLQRLAKKLKQDKQLERGTTSSEYARS